MIKFKSTPVWKKWQSKAKEWERIELYPLMQPLTFYPLTIRISRMSIEKEFVTDGAVGKFAAESQSREQFVGVVILDDSADAANRCQF